MKISDIVKQLQNKLPLYTNYFSSSVSVVSMTRSGSTVTVETSTAHGLNVNDNILVKGALTPNPITSLTQSGGLGTLITQYNHDVTKNLPLQTGDSTHITISGANESEYNGTFLIMSIPNSNVILFSIDNTAPASATGSPVLDEDVGIFFNGRQVVTTVPDTTHFTYEISNIPEATEANGTITINTGVRVSAEKSFDNAIRAYTKQPANSLWAFVVFGGSEVSKNRNNNSDSVANFREGNDLRQREINNINIFVFIPATNSTCPLDQLDIATNDVKNALLSSLHRAQFDSNLYDNKYGLAYVGNDIVAEAEGDAYIVWQYRFQGEIWTNPNDGVAPEYTRAFRHFEHTGYPDDTQGTQTGSIEMQGDLPDEKQ